MMAINWQSRDLVNEADIRQRWGFRDTAEETGLLRLILWEAAQRRYILPRELGGVTLYEALAIAGLEREPFVSMILQRVTAG